jgi:3-oxoacyl-[acyl-carrier-protein] synthase II
VVALDNPWVTETGLLTRIAAVVRGYDAALHGVEPRLARNLDRTSLFALGAAAEALSHAGLAVQTDLEDPLRRRVLGVDPQRLAVVIGSGIGGLTTLEIYHALWRETRRPTRIKRYTLPMLIPNAPAAQVAIRYGARAECKSVSTACAAGTMALGDAFRLLRDDEADVAIAGGAEGVACDEDAYALLGFDRLGTLSRRNDEPQRASRPFDRDRDGFVLGEGAAVLVLEREEHALARGATCLARIAGYAANCDGLSMLQPDTGGVSIVALIGAALTASGCAADEVDFVSAHGTSTISNDRTEATALRDFFGSRCAKIPVTALKSMTGHGIAASGPMETAACVLSMARGQLTPTINYEHPDPECDLDVVAHRPRQVATSLGLKLSYGFGGHNACLVLARS